MLNFGPIEAFVQHAQAYREPRARDGTSLRSQDKDQASSAPHILDCHTASQPLSSADCWWLSQVQSAISILQLEKYHDHLDRPTSSSPEYSD